MPDKRVFIDPAQPDVNIIQTAGKILAQDGIVIFPAQCLYGIAAHALSPSAIDRVFELKQRPPDNPLLVLVKNTSMIQELVTHIPETAEKLINAFWPGNLTLIFNAKPHVPSQLTAHTGKIGIRIPLHPVAKALVDRLDFPITGTSANLSGKAGCTTTKELPPSIITDCDLILDAGPVKGGKGSTIADVSGQHIQILREGKVPARQIQNILA